MTDPRFAQFTRQLNMVRESVGLPTFADENERRYAEEQEEVRRTYRVPVTLIRKGFVTIEASNPKSAESVVRVTAAFADDIEGAKHKEIVGTAVEL